MNRLLRKLPFADRSASDTVNNASSVFEVVREHSTAPLPSYDGPPIQLVVFGAGGRAVFLVTSLIRITLAPVVRIVLGDSNQGALDKVSEDIRYVLDRHSSEVETEIVTVLLGAGKEGDADRARALQTHVRVDSHGSTLGPTIWNKWCIVASVNKQHYADLNAAINAGYNIFCEKPLATTISDCAKLYRLLLSPSDHATASPLTPPPPRPRFLTGFVLRHAPLYLRVRSLLHEEKFAGKLISCEFNELLSREHGAYKFRNWRRFSDLAGPNILEKSCHDMDLMCWLMNDVPTKVAAFGGKDIFQPENAEVGEKIRKEVEQNGGAGKFVFRLWPTYPAVDDPFTSGGDVEDHVMAVLQFRSGTRASFHLSSMSALPQRRLLISGLEGAIEADLDSGTLRYQKMSSEFPKVESHKSSVAGDNHGGGDEWQIRRWWEEIVQVGTEWRHHKFTERDLSDHGATARDMVVSAVTALAVDMARREGRVVDLEAEVWADLGI
ncbi:hypothetical protein HDU93_003365 [Gonapodya sp. JEL0774]|nr:hypothetical protein HDU93_003365 [Gonapodya sp. JEL0774]